MMIALSYWRSYKRILRLAAFVVILTSIMTGIRLASNVETAKAVAGIYVNAATGSDSNDGTAGAPYKSITKGMDEADSGQTVFVAVGIYSESNTSERLPIQLKSGVILQGAAASTTWIQGTNSSSIVAASNVNASAKIDGFLILGGRADYGGGIYLNASSPTISNNIIMGNTANAYGGGIFCELSSSPTISNNSINQNTAGLGGAISCSSSSPTISRNDIRVNTCGLSGGGIYCDSSSPAILNNTITGNNGSLVGGGINCSNSSSPTILNNTILGNGATFGGGIASDSSSPTIFNCIVWGNGDDIFGCAATYSDIEDIEAGVGNISVYPMFDPGSGDYHLAPRSPCIDAGTNTGAPTTDIEGVSRPRDGDANGSSLTDIGAYEFTNAGPVTLYVSPAGSDTTGNGAAFHPFRSITKGMLVALPGDTVSVAAGQYNTAGGETFPISLKTGVALRGGGALTTTIQGSGSNPVVRAQTTVDSSAVIDGFTITGGNSADYGGGIRCWNSSPTITNNIITGNTAASMGGGIACFNYADPTISNNIISNNTAPNPGGDGGGICVYASSPVISSNTISNNFANSAGGGVVCYDAGYDAEFPTVLNNIVTGNYAEYGGGLSCDASSIISNNTIYGNTAASDGGGIFSFAPLTIFNCIIWSNTGGSLYGCTATYSDIEGGGAGGGNIADNPQFVSAGSGDYHLLPNSPCINAGTATGAPGTDKDGVARPLYGGFDMGAYEHVDLTAPTGTISINSVDANTVLSTVTLNLTAADTGGSGLYQMRFSNNGSVWLSDWEAYQTTRANWDLTDSAHGGNGLAGTKTVYVQYRDNAGNISSATISDTITLVNCVPVYRFYNFRQGVHFYTTNTIERNYLLGPGGNWTFRPEGTAFSAYPEHVSNSTAVYRFYNFLQGVHFYTANYNEYQTVLKTAGWTFRFEGTSYYAMPPATPAPVGFRPVYRFYNFRQGVHFYTANYNEYQTVLHTAGWTFRYEGVAYCVPN